MTRRVDPFDDVVEAAFHAWIRNRAQRIADGVVENPDGSFDVPERVIAPVYAEIDELSEAAAKIALVGAIVELAATLDVGVPQ